MNRYIIDIRKIKDTIQHMWNMWLAIRLLCNNQHYYIQEARRGGCKNDEELIELMTKDIMDRHKNKRLPIIRMQWQMDLARQLRQRNPNLATAEAAHRAADIVTDCEDHGFVKAIENIEGTNDFILIELTKDGSDFKSFWYLLKHIKEELGPTVAWGITTTLAVVGGLVAIAVRFV